MAKKKSAPKKKLSPKQLEDIYDSGEKRLSQERNDFLLPQILDFVRDKKWMNIRPEYQRRLVWDAKKKSRFIESLLMNIPIPPIFLYETDLGRYEVMDGQQRLNAIIEFYENDLKLRGLDTWTELNGYTFKRCPPRIQRGLDRRRISATVLLAENISIHGNGDSIRREVFERLNTGGASLNAQELRNSLYSGDFNDLIIKLAGGRLFDEIWGIPPYEDHYDRNENFISPELAENEYFQRMKDCEIVLRFFALRRADKIRGSMRNILDTCMSDYLAISSSELADCEETFVECLQIAHDIFGAKTFKIKNDKGRLQRSIPLYDAVMVAVDRLRTSAMRMVKAKHKIAAEFDRLMSDTDTYEIIVGKPNTADAVKSRLNVIYTLLKKYA